MSSEVFFGHPVYNNPILGKYYIDEQGQEVIIPKHVTRREPSTAFHFVDHTVLPARRRRSSDSFDAGPKPQDVFPQATELLPGERLTEIRRRCGSYVLLTDTGRGFYLGSDKPSGEMYRSLRRDLNNP